MILVIGTGLRKITYLNRETIGNTLTSLCVTDCEVRTCLCPLHMLCLHEFSVITHRASCSYMQLTEITKGIYLPNLKQLFLHRNQIKQISGLDGFVKALHSN